MIRGRHRKSIISALSKSSPRWRRLYFAGIETSKPSLYSQKPLIKYLVSMLGIACAYGLGFATVVSAQKVQVVRWPQVQHILQQPSDTTYVLNFWATWCKPCVAELPHFEQMRQEFLGQKVKIVLISMDFAKEINSRVIPFVQKQNVQNTVWVLNEPDANAWIDKISPKWSGAIPATLIINNKKHKKAFFEQSLDSTRLRQELADFL